MTDPAPPVDGLFPPTERERALADVLRYAKSEAMKACRAARESTECGAAPDEGAWRCEDCPACQPLWLVEGAVAKARKP